MIEIRSTGRWCVMQLCLSVRLLVLSSLLNQMHCMSRCGTPFSRQSGNARGVQKNGSSHLPLRCCVFCVAFQLTSLLQLLCPPCPLTCWRRRRWPFCLCARRTELSTESWRSVYTRCLSWLCTVWSILAGTESLFLSWRGFVRRTFWQKNWVVWG